MKKSILLAGYYGAGNLGDDAIMVSIIDSVKNLRDDVHFKIVSFNPQKTKIDFGVDAVHWRDIHAVAKAILQADLVMIGGGGLFMDYWGMDENSFFRSVHGGISTYGTPAWLAEAFGVPWMFYGVGIGPLFTEKAREHTRRLFSQAPLATLRDEDSVTLLQELGLTPLPKTIHLTADPAFGLVVPSEYRNAAKERCVQLGIDPGKPLLGVSIRYWDRLQPPATWIPLLAEGLRTFVFQTSAQVILLPFQVGGEDLTNDLEICGSLQENIDLPGSIHLVRERLHPFDMQALLGCCDMILGMRLHALLMGTNEGIPVLGLAYDPKVSSFMKKGGMEKWVCPLPFKPQGLADMLLESWKDRDKRAIQAQKYQQVMFPLMRKNAELAVQLLNAARKKQSQQNLISFILERLEQMQYMDEQIQPLTTRIQELIGETQSLRSKMNEAQSQVILMHQRLNEIETSRTYRMAIFFQKIRNLLLQPGSRRERWLLTLIKRLNNRS